MKKRILSIILSIVMLVSLLPTTALALPSHSHCVCGGSVTVGGHTHENITSWVAWDGTDKDGETDGIQLTAGSWYLTDNVNLTETLTISSGTVNLCLNEKTITNRKNITVSSGATLNICACGSGGTVKAIVNSDGNITNNGTVNVYGGTVQGSGSGNTVKGSGIDNYGTVNVYGGTVKAPHGQGHGIYNEAKGTANIYGGTVSSGSSEGILNKKYFTSGIVNVYGGTVIGATNGITNNGILNLSGGSVGNLDGNYGISNNGTLNLSGAPTITGTWADIYLNSDKLITIGEGGLTYTSDKAISVRMNTPGTFTSGWTAKMGGNAENYGSYFTSAMDGYTVQPDGNELKLAEPSAAETHSHDMSVECGNTDPMAFTAWDGTTTPTGNVYLTNDVNRAITISSGTVNLCLNGHSITRSGNSTITVSEGATLNICDCSTGETGGKIANTYSSSQGRGINNSGTVNVYGGTIEATGLMGRGIYNDGSGTINFSGGSVSGKSYGIYNNGTGAVNIIGGNVNEGIYNSSTGAVTVSGGTVESTIYGIHNNGAGTIVVSGGSVSGDANGISNNNGGIVTVSGGNVSSERGHGIFSGSSQNTVTVTDGSITASSSECYGIYNSYGKVTVSGGSVTATGSDGRGIYNDSGTLTVIGGSITATGPESYGIENRFSNSFALSGAPAVSGTAADVYLFSEVVITIADALTTYAPENAISVKWEKWDDDYNKVSVSGTFTSGWTTNMGNNAANYGSYFTSANSGYTVQPDGSGELKLAESTDFTATVNLTKDGAAWTDSGKTIALYQSGATKYDLTGSNGVYTASNVAPGTYDVYVDGADTNVDVSSANAVTVEYFTVTYNKGSSTGGTVPAPAIVLKGSTYIVSTSTPLQLGGYSQSGWNTTEVFNGNRKDSLTVDERTTLNPSWSVSLVVNKSATYNNSSVDAANGSVVYVEGASYVMTALHETFTGANYTYVWKDGNGNEITGATNASYSVQNLIAGTHQYKVTVKCKGPYGGSAEQTQKFKITINETTPITGTVVIELPTGDDTPNFGDTLTANYDGTETVSYQWYAANTSNGNGTPISNATVSSFTVDDPALVGKYIYVVVSGTGNYSGTVESAATTAVSKATPTHTPPTAITDLEYTGQPQSLVNAGTATGGTMYYAIGGKNNPTGTWSTSIPTKTDAGSYYVWYKIVGEAGYTDVGQACVPVTIAPKKVDEPAVNGSYTYTGSEQTVELNGYDSSYMTITGNKGTNAGDYEVSITLDTNHTWMSGSEGKVQWRIEPATPTVTWPAGTAYVNDTSVTLTGGSAAGVGTETSVEGSFTLEAVDLTSASTKTVKITFAPNSTNYKNVEKTDYSVTVSKRTVESVAEQTAITNAVYGTEQDALGLPASVEITVSGNKKYTAPVTWSGYGKFNLNEQTLTGTLDLSAIAGEVENPNSITASIVVDLQEKNAATFNYENKTETYNGSSISHEISGTLEGVASISYSYVGSEYAASAVAPTNAGVYEVTATFTMQPGYAAVAPKTAILTISPKEVGLDWSALTGEELVYSGTAKTLTAVAIGLVDGDSCTVTVELVGDNINVGTFSYEATALSNANYKLPVDVSSPEYTITPKTLTLTADSHEVYVGSRQPELTYTIDGLVGTDTLTTAPTLSTDANMYRAGTCAITFASEAAAGNNYSITYVNGTLTVKNYPYIPTYDVEIADDITGGDVSASKKLAYRGDTITITVAPNAGYELAKLTVTDSRNNVVAVTKTSDSKYTFKMPGYDVEIDAVFAKIDTTCPGDSSCPMYPYTDLYTSLWYHDGIHYCIEHGLMVGTGTNIFEPNTATTRAMTVTILWRLEGGPIVNYAMNFEDVAADQWYTEAIRWAASEKIVEGYGDGKFGTNDAITREQMVTIMFLYAKYKGYDVSVGENTNILSYDDAFDVAEWAITAMQWACGSGMIHGIADGNQMNLAPQGNATRAQAAAILQHYCENVANKD